MFTGTDQLATVLADASDLGLGLVLALMVGKMLAFAVSQASGFVGGPIFPALFIGGTAGVAVHLLLPDIPMALAFSCMLAAVVGGLASAPFAMVLLAGLLTQVGALQSAPILLAVISSYVTVEGTGFLVNLAKRARAQTYAEPPPQSSG
jgi:H+/Cl- antiporter ClcA